MPRKHQFDEVMDDLKDWMTGMRAHLVAGMYQGDRAPFAANVSNKDALAYYNERLFPNGQRDEGAIDAFIQARGEPAYARLLLEIDRANRRDLNTDAPPSRPTESPEPPAPGGY